MSAPSATASGRRAAERNMTDTWAVYRYTDGVLNETTGQYEPTATTVYSGPGKLQSFESYEQNPVAGARDYTVMRPILHLPVNATSASIEIGDTAVCLASPLDSTLVGTSVKVEGIQSKTYMTARRFPVSEVLTQTTTALVGFSAGFDTGF